MKTQLFEVDLITVPSGRRAVCAEAVERLATSIAEIGLKTPISVLIVGDGEETRLVAGAHRLAAFKSLGLVEIPAVVIEGGSVEAELWEISENLHRAELTALQRDEQVARWIELSKLRQPDEVLGGRGNKGGVINASREIGISEPDARRANKVASLSDDAKQAAQEVGLDDNRTALLEAARKPISEQAGYLRDRAVNKVTSIESDIKERASQEAAEVIAEYVPGAAWDTLKANLYAAGAKNVANALTNLTGNSVMDKAGWK